MLAISIYGGLRWGAYFRGISGGSYSLGNFGSLVAGGLMIKGNHFCVFHVFGNVDC